MAGTEILLDSCDFKINCHFSNFQQLRKSSLSFLLLGVERADGPQFESEHSSLTFLRRFSLLPFFVPGNLNFGNTTNSLKISSSALFSLARLWYQTPRPFKKCQAVLLWKPVKFHRTTPRIHWDTRIFEIPTVDNWENPCLSWRRSYLEGFWAIRPLIYELLSKKNLLSLHFWL